MSRNALYAAGKLTPSCFSSAATSPGVAGVPVKPMSLKRVTKADTVLSIGHDYRSPHDNMPALLDIPRFILRVCLQPQRAVRRVLQRDLPLGEVGGHGFCFLTVDEDALDGAVVGGGAADLEL